jgi:hypothetical protein
MEQQLVPTLLGTDFIKKCLYEPRTRKRDWNFQKNMLAIVLSDGREILWSDKLKFNMFGSDGKSKFGKN